MRAGNTPCGRSSNTARPLLRPGMVSSAAEDLHYGSVGRIGAKLGNCSLQPERNNRSELRCPAQTALPGCHLRLTSLATHRHPPEKHPPQRCPRDERLPAAYRGLTAAMDEDQRITCCWRKLPGPAGPWLPPAPAGAGPPPRPSRFFRIAGKRLQPGYRRANSAQLRDLDVPYVSDLLEVCLLAKKPAWSTRKTSQQPSLLVVPLFETVQEDLQRARQ